MINNYQATLTPCPLTLYLILTTNAPYCVHIDMPSFQLLFYGWIRIGGQSMMVYGIPTQ